MQRANPFKRFINNSRNQPEKLIKYGRYLSRFLLDCLNKTKAKGYIVGLSGGIDSALALALLSANEGYRLMGVFIDINSNKDDLACARSLAKKFGAEFQHINLTDYYKLLVQGLRVGKSKIARINLKSRLRAITLYALAQANHLLTVGTTNADERLVGYYTKFGDNANDVAPLTYLNKSQVRFLAGHYRVPDTIIKRKPSAGLYPGQTDERDIGITYNELDRYLSHAKMDKYIEEQISRKYLANKHKLNAPIKPKKFLYLRNGK